MVASLLGEAAEEYFRELLADRNLSFDPALIRNYLSPLLSKGSEKSLTYQEQGYQVAMSVFGETNQHRPDGLLVRDDMMMDGVLIAFQQLGIEVGRDVKIATVANAGSPTLFGRTENMIVIEIDPAELVQTMFAELDAIMEGKMQAGNIASRAILIPPKLRVEGI